MNKFIKYLLDSLANNDKFIKIVIDKIFGDTKVKDNKNDDDDDLEDEINETLKNIDKTREEINRRLIKD